MSWIDPRDQIASFTEATPVEDVVYAFLEINTMDHVQNVGGYPDVFSSWDDFPDVVVVAGLDEGKERRAPTLTYYDKAKLAALARDSLVKGPDFYEDDDCDDDDDDDECDEGEPEGVVASDRVQRMIDYFNDGLDGCDWFGGAV
jgi:hypothetical protein